MCFKPAALLAALLLLVSCATTGRPRETVMIAANPHASAAGAEMLRRGGDAVDAAIAAMLVLGLVEPQSAGLGGGGFLLYFDAGADRVDAYDGREIAPAGATPDMFLQANGQPMDFLTAVRSGRSVGAPSLIAMLKRAHEEHGLLPWAALFEPAIRLADEGFPVSQRMHNVIAAAAARGQLAQSPAARAYLFTPEGEPLPVGYLLRNPRYAESLRAIAAQGPRAMQEGPLAEEIVAAVHADPIPGTLSLSDLQDVAPRRLDAVCGPFRVYRVCSMPPPSSGGVAVIEALGLYARVRPQPGGPENADDWAAFIWATRLAYADRDYYVGDDQYVSVPTQALIDPRYLDVRARDIDLTRAPAEPVVQGDPVAATGDGAAIEWDMGAPGVENGTTHMVVMDRYGNAVSMTATVESAFGSHRMAGGFFLNNQLTDFSFVPSVNGRPVANAAAPGKRPRSSMAPALIFGEDGELEGAVGSPGGSAIISYVTRAIISTLDWNMTMQDAVSAPNVVPLAGAVRVETRFADEIGAALAARGFAFREVDNEDSGLHGYRLTPAGVQTGVDPRREGVAVVGD